MHAENDILNKGRMIESPNRYFFANMQQDGNFVVYHRSGNGGNRALWATHTVGKGQYLVFQNDGNLVIYHNGGPTWASNTQHRGHVLRM